MTSDEERAAFLRRNDLRPATEAELDLLRAASERLERRHEIKEQRLTAAHIVTIRRDRGWWDFHVESIGFNLEVASSHRTLDDAIAALLDWFYPEEDE